MMFYLILSEINGSFKYKVTEDKKIAEQNTIIKQDSDKQYIYLELQHLQK